MKDHGTDRAAQREKDYPFLLLSHGCIARMKLSFMLSLSCVYGLLHSSVIRFSPNGAKRGGGGGGGGVGPNAKKQQTVRGSSRQRPAREVKSGEAGRGVENRRKKRGGRTSRLRRRIRWRVLEVTPKTPGPEASADFRSFATLSDLAYTYDSCYKHYTMPKPQQAILLRNLASCVL